MSSGYTGRTSPGNGHATPPPAKHTRGMEQAADAVEVVAAPSTTSDVARWSWTAVEGAPASRLGALARRPRSQVPASSVRQRQSNRSVLCRATHTRRL